MRSLQGSETLLCWMATLALLGSWCVLDVHAFAPTQQMSPSVHQRLIRPKPIVSFSSPASSVQNWQSARHYPHQLTSTASHVQDSIPEPDGILRNAKRRFKARPGPFLLIPVIASLVGWFTNYLAVQMIFFPIQFRGIPLYRLPEVPLGLIGWQGIVPCKTKTMSIAMCNMITSQLLTVSEAFGRLNPVKMANLLAPRVPSLGIEIIKDLFPNSLKSWPVSAWKALSKLGTYSPLHAVSVRVLTHTIKDIQCNIDSVFSLESCVVSQMLKDRSKLGGLFQAVAQKELDFLTNSGLWFGFLLGLIQMALALVWENPWSLSIGGGIVGLATNWLALKWIFEPINPTKIGPFLLQGMFLRRQKEVAAVFSRFFANKVLSSPRLWDSMLHDPTTAPAVFSLLRRNFQKLLTVLSLGLFQGSPKPELIDSVTRTVIAKLPNHIHVLHGYIDKTLCLEETLRTKMEAMSAVKFERVLHPIFEQDEMTLILAGAALGFGAGLVQQGITTGAIRLTNPFPRLRRCVGTWCQKIIATIKRIPARKNSDACLDT